MNTMQNATLNRVMAHNKNIYTNEFIANIISKMDNNVESYTYNKDVYSLGIVFKVGMSRDVIINTFKQILISSLPAEFIKDEPFISDGLFFNVLTTSMYTCIIYL
jgi:hypothetical protein